jgi:transaldolase
MTNQLTQLKKMTIVVADTGDINAIEQYAPEDATTNPSLIFKAAKMEQYSYLIENAITLGKEHQKDKKQHLDFILDNLAVNFGKEILKIVPGRISTEVDARLSFDQEATLKRARQLISLYDQAGIPKKRILIKIAATWEGIKAAEILEKEGINCNLTLLFGFCQAVACAEAGVFLISPFVGRILDWFKKNTGENYTAEKDPGVLSVSKIYQYYKQHGYSTVVMGASFRNSGEILQLAGCDRLTIGPNFLEELQKNDSNVQQMLSKDMVLSEDMEKIHLDENSFRWLLNEDAMATEKLAEGIRNFSKDIVKLEDYIKSRL